jgi:EAL domain-containing protein (putative c-di-GMP-specific phosphodiesterase class I)
MQMPPDVQEGEPRSVRGFLKYDLPVGAAREARDAATKDQMATQRRIQDALAFDLLVLHAQPIVGLVSGMVERHELLLRMRNDGTVLTQPGEFLPEAERSGLVGQIDHWVVGQAIEMLNEGIGSLEVNLSGKSLTDRTLPGYIETRLDATGADPAGLVFEITETAAIANMAEAIEFAERLTKLGCHFAIDDFGVAFGSLYYLKHLPVDYLKIDGEFIRGLVTGEADQVIVKAIVELARGLGIGTIAEFVGDEETLALLKKLGVDYAQGDVVGHPRPVSELLAQR